MPLFAFIIASIYPSGQRLEVKSKVEEAFADVVGEQRETWESQR